MTDAIALAATFEKGLFGLHLESETPTIMIGVSGPERDMIVAALRASASTGGAPVATTFSPERVDGMVRRLRHAIITAQNDEFSEPMSEKRTRHIERQETFTDAAEFLDELLAALASPPAQPAPRPSREMVESVAPRLEAIAEWNAAAFECCPQCGATDAQYVGMNSLCRALWHNHAHLRASSGVGEPVEAIVQRVKEACAGVADRAAARCEGGLRGEMAAELAVSIRRLIPPFVPGFASAGAEESPVAAWIEFTDEGKIRFWTSNPSRAVQEIVRGRCLRPITLGELVAWAARGLARSSASGAAK